MDLADVNFSDGALFYGSAPTLEDLARFASSSIETIRTSDNARLIVLEAWLLLDYSVREFLMAGLSLHRYSTSSYDLRYELLPRGFPAILDLVEGLRSAHNPRPPDPPNGGIRSSIDFWRFLKCDHPDFVSRLDELQEEFRKQRNLGQPREAVILGGVMRPPESHDEYCDLPEPWVTVARGLGEAWFKGARRLNKARNMAAHSHDQNSILRAFGLSGANALHQLRTQCEKLILDLVGVEKDTAS